MREGRRGFYFKGTLLVSLACCVAGALAAYLFLFNYGSQDEQEYHRLMLVSNPTLAGASEQEPYTARQERVGVRKDFSFMRNGVPLKVRLTSDEAELVLDRGESSTQIIEEMHGVKAFMQEELFYILSDGREALLHSSGRLLLRGAPADDTSSWVALQGGERPMQIMRYLEADSGAYFYKTDQCKADHVIVTRYVMPGHELGFDFSQGQQILKGLADSVEFSMAGDDPHFTAQRLKATVFMPGRM